MQQITYEEPMDCLICIDPMVVNFVCSYFLINRIQMCCLTLMLGLYTKINPGTDVCQTVGQHLETAKHHQY